MFSLLIIIKITQNYYGIMHHDIWNHNNWNNSHVSF
jgi:hypothetical protein